MEKNIFHTWFYMKTKQDKIAPGSSALNLEREANKKKRLVLIYLLFFLSFSFKCGLDIPAILVHLTSPLVSQGYGARYLMDIRTTWCQTTPPGCPFGSQHFSPPIGATHLDGEAFWASGSRASEGVRSMAEVGQTAPLAQELNVQLAEGKAGTVFIAQTGQGNSPGRKALEFTVHHSHPFFSFTTMIAPSPDWFIGTREQNLLDGNGKFKESLKVKLFAYDAGTDSADSFMHTNTPTNPRENITRMDMLSDSNPFRTQALLGELNLYLLESD